MTFEATMKAHKTTIEDILKTVMFQAEGPEKVVYEAMTYSLLAGGKRLRPMIMLGVYKLFQNDTKPIEGFLAAIEMIHTYSLIHDDLPAMDDDDLRRGLPTCHVKYGEDIAILAGDGLLNMAYEVMAASTIEHDLGAKGLNAFLCLGTKAGVKGMVGGQVVDIINEDVAIDLDTVTYIHLHKTAALLEAAFMMGGYLGGATDAAIQTLELIGRYVGMAFQIQDDLLDVTSTEEHLGKPINSDQKNAKTTYLTLKGMDQARLDITDFLDKSEALLGELAVKDPTFITSLIEFIRNRDY